MANLSQRLSEIFIDLAKYFFHPRAEMLVVGARNYSIIGNIGSIHISATGIIDVVLDAVVSGDLSTFDKLGGDQQLAGMTD